jgi:hypothetical protein
LKAVRIILEVMIFNPPEKEAELGQPPVVKLTSSGPALDALARCI